MIFCPEVCPFKEGQFCKKFKYFLAEEFVLNPPFNTTFKGSYRQYKRCDKILKELRKEYNEKHTH